MKDIFIKINLIKNFILKDIYIFYVNIKFYLLSYKGYLSLEKYVNELFYFDIFNPISNIDIRLNYRILFNFIKNKNKKFYIYFNIYKYKAFNAFKSLKLNIKYNDFIIKRIRNNENSIIKNKVLNNYRYDYKIK